MTTHDASGSGLAPQPASSKRNLHVLVIPFLIGGAVVVALGTYGRLHEPTFVAVNLAGFSGALVAKAWLATGAVTLAIVQLITALAMWGKLPVLSGGPVVAAVHRWSGRGAFLLAVPVAMHCLYAVGFQTASPRVLAHSLFGCFFFGAFTVKMLVLTRKGVPGWALPVLGGAVFTGLVVLWLTSSLWFFTTFGITF